MEVAAGTSINDIAGRALDAYGYLPFDQLVNSAVMQLPMLPRGMTRAMLDRSKALPGLGFYGDTTPGHAPPVPEEVEQLVDAIQRQASPFLRGLVPYTTIVNWTEPRRGGHGEHNDPPACRAISAFNLSGEATLELVNPRTKAVAFKQKLAPGTGYIITGRAVQFYKHRISPAGTAVRAVVLTRYVAEELVEELKA